MPLQRCAQDIGVEAPQHPSLLALLHAETTTPNLVSPTLHNSIFRLNLWVKHRQLNSARPLSPILHTSNPSRSSAIRPRYSGQRRRRCRSMSVPPAAPGLIDKVVLTADSCAARPGRFPGDPPVASLKLRTGLCVSSTAPEKEGGNHAKIVFVGRRYHCCFGGGYGDRRRCAGRRYRTTGLAWGRQRASSFGNGPIHLGRPALLLVQLGMAGRRLVLVRLQLASRQGLGRSARVARVATAEQPACSSSAEAESACSSSAKAESACYSSAEAESAVRPASETTSCYDLTTSAALARRGADR